MQRPRPRLTWIALLVLGVVVGAGAAVLFTWRSLICEGVEVLPGEDLQALLEAHPPGTRFCIQGVHRLAESLEPRDRQELVGDGAAVLSGATVLDGWQRDGALWYVEGQVPRLHERGTCLEQRPACGRSESVFRDGARLEQVLTLGELEAGSFYLDEERGRVYVSEDPTGDLTEAAVAEGAVRGAADGVTIQGLVIEKFGNPAQEGAVHIEGPRWSVLDNVVRLNHGTGIRTESSAIAAVIRGNRVHDQGQLGIGGLGRDLTIEDNVIADNNQAGFRPSWEAGGGKWVAVEGIVIRGNVVIGNFGHGLWTDLDVDGALIEDNEVVDNARTGIFHEISWSAVIRNNTVRGNGLGVRGSWASGAGIRIANSAEVEVHGNLVADNAHGIVVTQQDRGEGPRGVYDTFDVRVHANDIRMSHGYSGFLSDVGDHRYFEDGRVRFWMNEYEVDDPTARRWMWGGERLDTGAWQATHRDEQVSGAD